MKKREPLFKVLLNILWWFPLLAWGMSGGTCCILLHEVRTLTAGCVSSTGTGSGWRWSFRYVGCTAKPVLPWCMVVVWSCSFMSYELWVMSCELWVMSYELWVMSYELWVMSYELSLFKFTKFIWFYLIDIQLNTDKTRQFSTSNDNALQMPTMAVCTLVSLYSLTGLTHNL